MKKADRIYYGGDYNPDQWDEATIDEDMRLFKKAGINLLTLPVFSWAKLEPEEGVYCFEWLDKIVDKIWSHGIYLCLATPTTAQPAWLSTRYPHVLPVDIAGRRRTHGMRVFFCVNSLKYRERAAAIAEEMAKRYANHPGLAMWHVSNEYGTYCYCPECEAKFRLWLKKRYGTIEELNKRWHTCFWGRIVTNFEEITLPTELNDDYRFNPTIQLDYMRFVTDSTAECFQNEYQVLKKYNPEIPIQTNMSGYIKKLDQFTITKNLDVVGWDNYPWPHDEPYFVAMKHDIMRGLKGGQSFVLTEQSPNQQNWQPYNLLKRPGEVRRLSYQAMAHGADTCLFFQMRQSIAGQEKFHGAIISHSGREDTRIFKETVKLGQEFSKIKDKFIGGRTPAKVGMLFDWNNWWALELSSGPSKDMDYLKTFSLYYKTLHKQNIGVDILPYDGDINGYEVIVAPMLYMVKEGIAAQLTEFVKKGGTLITTVMSGLVDENDRCVFGAYPGELKEMLGIWVEETDALRPYEKNVMKLTTALSLEKTEYDCGFLCDIIHPEGGAEVLAVYSEDFYAGSPCVTVNNYGKGKAYYVGTQPEQRFLEELVEQICKENQIMGIYPATEGVEITERVSEKGNTIFVINHKKETAWVDFLNEEVYDLINGKKLKGKVELPGGDVLVCERKR
ncbi:beta-galactosidase [Lachnospiraceae bacterium OttesenSCG-928-D06]|nr:beta-galactosidase [Lachnospiraceae bacterium OttesenSCG-928-D06]